MPARSWDQGAWSSRRLVAICQPRVLPLLFLLHLFLLNPQSLISIKVSRRKARFSATRLSLLNKTNNNNNNNNNLFHPQTIGKVKNIEDVDSTKEKCWSIRYDALEVKNVNEII